MSRRQHQREHLLPTQFFFFSSPPAPCGAQEEEEQELMSFTGRICIPVMERLRDCAGVFFFSAKRAFRAFACAHSFTACVYMCGFPLRAATVDAGIHVREDRWSPEAALG